MTNENNSPKHDKSTRRSTGQALLWAVALIGCAVLLKGHDKAEEVFLLLVVLSSTSILSQGNAAAEWRCLKRKFSGDTPRGAS